LAQASRSPVHCRRLPQPLRCNMACLMLLLALVAAPADAMVTRTQKPVDVYALRQTVLKSQVVLDKIAKTCHTPKHKKVANCETRVGDTLFCQLLDRSYPDLSAAHCGGGAKKAAAKPVVTAAAPVAKALVATGSGSFAAAKAKIETTQKFMQSAQGMATAMGCNMVKKAANCENYVKEAAFCLAFAEKMGDYMGMAGEKEQAESCKHIDDKMPALSLVQAPTFLQVAAKKAPEDELAKEMTHDLEMNFNKIAPFGKEDTAKELQDHAAKTQDTLVDAVENAEVAEIKRAVFRALTRLRAATIKEFDTIARLETQAIDAYNDAHHYRAENPLAHLHEDEAPVETDKLKSFH